MTALVIATLYLVIGLFALLLFNYATGGRLQKNLNKAREDTQSQLASSGNYVGHKSSMLLLLGAMWLFWPFVFIGAVTKGKKED